MALGYVVRGHYRVGTVPKRPALCSGARKTRHVPSL